ncbi:hypothetical protein BCV70DRAFT_4898 [Testicularia cyperi]|uniref:RING-type domain-containing protein n=1 Tax=Testicularia cyperi TaxID=1882483 RepID=A0A317XWL3_9BASI|nr:hypothetical protein BCV70DRAFT_4898 [Testicularia cyperi]
MGQQQTKEYGSHGSPAHHGGHAYGSSSRGMTASASGGMTASASASSLSPPSPPPLPSHLSDEVKIDEGGLVPHGVYTGPQDYDQLFVRQSIVDRRLAPFCQGFDDEDENADRQFNSECPICFLYYPTPLNFSRCCHQPICSECFVQMKRADPNAHNPPSSEAVACPFCVEPDFGVTYLPPEAIEAAKTSSGADSPNDATDATNFAEMAIGTGGVGARDAGKKKVLPADDPSVITVDQVRPDWQHKLAQAQAAVARRANRRVIMRQVGDRLIPIGISSSRMGADLAAAAESGRINMNGPGGSIILNDGQTLPGASPITTSRRRSSRPSRGAEVGGLPDLARMMRMANGEDMEELMLMEAMRLSLLEHEEQQRKRAEEEKKKSAQQAQTQQQSSPSSTQAPQQTGTSAASGAHSRSTSLAQTIPARSVLEESEAQSPTTATGSATAVPVASAGSAVPSVVQTSANASSLGLSQSLVDELSELIEDGAGPSPPASLPSTGNSAVPVSANGSATGEPSASIMDSPTRPTRTQIPAPVPVPVPQPVASMGSALDSMHISSSANNSSDTTGAHGYPSPPLESDAGKHQINVGTSTPPFTSGSSPPTQSRMTNPNNPFRRSVGEQL